MTLTTRLLVFFLAALAAVLSGFSAALYLLAARHLHRQADERLTAALNVLSAAAEVSPGGVEWEPAERRLAVGGDVVWIVSDPNGGPVDRAVPTDGSDFFNEVAGQLRSTGRAARKRDWQGDRWLFRQERVEPPGPVAGSKPPAEGEKKYPALVITVGVSLESVRATLQELALGLVGGSVGVWVVALLAGRAVCRRALRPVARMAEAARGMTAADLSRRLEVPSTGDEVEDLGRAFNGLLDRVGEAFERQRRFTAEASHQLRTPLTALLGQVEVSLRRVRDGDEYRRALEAAHRQGDRLRRIVDALLFLARADAEAQLPDRQPTDLAAWLRDHVAATWGEHPRAADIRVEASPVDGNVHAVLLGELVNVLVDNACKYSPPGTPIVVRVGPEDGGVELSVADAGGGIVEADRTRLFEPFVRSADARRRGVEGVGLGLAVAKRIAVAHGGTLAVGSTPGGSCFTLRLPPADSSSGMLASVESA